MSRIFNDYNFNDILGFFLSKNIYLFVKSPFICKFQITMSKILLLKIIFLSTTIIKLRAQESESIISPTHIAIPPAPNAAALGKFGDVPVSYYTGIPNISVPIYELKSSRLSVPISLNYHASGVKADEVASWVGIGWALNAGGVISRTLRGSDDFGSNGLQYKPKHINEIDAVNDYVNVLKGVIDTQPDVFHYSSPTVSGKFVASDTCSVDYGNCTYFTTPFSNNLIKPVKVQGGINWKIISPDGTEYTYGRLGIYGEVDYTTSVNENSSGGISTSSFISAWHLAKIKSSDGCDSVLFEYMKDNIMYDQMGSENRYKIYNASNDVCTTNQLINDYSFVDLQISEAKLSKIISSNIEIELIQSSDIRTDLSGGHKLSSIKIKNRNGGLIKQIDFSYGYFVSNNQGVGDYAGNRYRLKLESIKEFGSDGKSNPPYVFNYNESEALPPRITYSQDHWGYFNSNTKPTLIPQYIKTPNSTYFYYSYGANRETDSTKVKLGTISQVTYPTGGYTKYEFEANSVSMTGDLPAEKIEFENIINMFSRPRDNFDTISTFTLDRSYTAYIEFSTTCVGLIEAPQAFANVSGPGQFLYGGGCGAGANSNSGSSYFILEPGVYTVQVSSEWFTAQAKSAASMKISLLKNVKPNEENPYYVGGVRVKSIADYSANGAVVNVRKFDYTTLENDTLFSSGVLVNEPTYIGTLKNYVPDNSMAYVYYYPCDYYVFASSSRIPLGNTQGSHLGYRKVTVTYGTNGQNGKSVFEYTSPIDFSDSPNGPYPYVPENFSQDYKRGLLIRERHFSASNEILKEQNNEYEFLAGKAFGVSIGYVFGMSNVGKPTPSLTDYSKRQYRIRTNWFYKMSTSTIDYSPSGNITSQVYYYYDHPTQINLSRVVSENSLGQKRSNYFKYAYDYSSDVVDLMIQKNMISVPLQNYSWIKTGQDSTLVGGINTEYIKTATNKVLLKSQKQLVTDKPLTSIPSLYLPEYWKDVFFVDQYDESGNVIQYVDQTGITNSIIWDNKNSSIDAVIKNASILSVAYTSFEYDVSGNWIINSTNRVTDSYTGSKSYNLSNGNLTKSGLDAVKSYKVTLWAKGAQPLTINGVTPTSGETKRGWTYYELVVQGLSSVVIAGGKLIDEVRLYPIGSEMTSYTHKVGYGITTTTDSNNQPTFYEYDSFGRLSAIKDSSGNILKAYTYNYRVSSSGTPQN